MKLYQHSKNFIEIAWQDQQPRPFLLILPGGGYEYTSWREAQPVVNAFASESYHTGIYYYREEKLLHPHTHIEAKELIEQLRKDPRVNKIYLVGFSAGGHFAATIMTYYPHLVNAGVLAYAPITSDIKYRHLGSLMNLLGPDITKEKAAEVSLDLHVTKETPPCFIFHTQDDAIVHVENALMFAEALRKNKVPFALHVYPEGLHGFSVGSDDVAYSEYSLEEFQQRFAYMKEWVELAKKFLRRY
ncbi:MAG: alpha/beta hydrolase family protein [Bacilli bacterium]